MNNWLGCEVSAGMFSTEFAVTAQQFDGRSFSLFALIKDVRTEHEPNGTVVSGYLHVKPMKKRDDLVLVELPQPSLEVGSIVTVKASQLQSL